MEEADGRRRGLWTWNERRLGTCEAASHAPGCSPKSLCTNNLLLHTFSVYGIGAMYFGTNTAKLILLSIQYARGRHMTYRLLTTPA